MQLISIAHRMKIIQTTPAIGLKRRRSVRINTLLSSSVANLRAKSSLHCQYTSVSNNDVNSCQHVFSGPAPFTSTNNCNRRDSSYALFPDHYRSYGAQTFHHHRSQKHLSAAKPPPRANNNNHIKQDTARQTLHAISKRLSFFFSDANLRHDAYARPILEKYENRYLPLDVIMSFKSIQKLTDDPNVVLDAVDYMNHINSNDENTIKLISHITNSGEVYIGRTEPFDYNASMKGAQQRVILLEGWPSDQDTRRIEDRLWSLLCTKNTTVNKHRNQNEKNRIAYWNTDIGKGLKTIEFQTDEGAADAWSNLATAAKENTANPRNPNLFRIEMKEGADGNKEYQIRVQNLSLVARSITNDANEIETSSDDVEQMLQSLEQMLAEPTKDVQTQNESKQVVSPFVDHPPAEPKWWTTGNATPSLNKCVEAMDEIFQKHSELPPPSREWLHEYKRGKRKMKHNDIDESFHQNHNLRLELCNDAANLISCIKQSIAEGKIRGLGGKDAYLLSELLGRAMLIFSETPPPDGTHSRGRVQSDMPTNSDEALEISPFEACLGVISMLRSLNLDILSSHYACTIRAACHEARWEEASKVFLNQINGVDHGDASDNMITGGFSPINPALGWDQPLEVGLYAVARDAWQKSILAEQQGNTGHIDSSAKQVFDTAMKMCMISPSEQDSYVLAAGSALGRAGLWSECLDLATEPGNIATYGPSITAAAMLSCIESARYTEAIDAFDYFMSGNQSVASEWQWSGGNITAMEPICRDLALTAMGHISRGGYSQEARKMFDLIMEEGSPLSCNGLLGLMHSLENDDNWKEAVEVLDRFMSSNFNTKGTKWRIVPDVIHLQKESKNGDGLASDVEVADLLERVVAPVMRVCNNHGHFGLAAVLCTVANKLCFDSSGCTNLMSNDEGEAIGIPLKNVPKSNPVFEAYMHSLCGLGCKPFAERLIREREGADIDRIVSLPKRMRKNLPKPESWFGADRSINYLMEAKNAIQEEPRGLCPESSFLFGRGLARAMEYCNDSNQPAAALYLFHHTARILLPKKDQHLADQFKSFIGMGNQTDENNLCEELFSSDYVLDLNGIEMTDSILAAVMNAYIKMGRPEHALTTFNNATSQLESPHLLTQSSDCIMDVLLQMDADKCLESLDDRSSTPSTFIVIAKYLANKGVWHEIGELYNKARRAGCISEELGFITMQALNESELAEGKVVVFRKIAEDVANTIGMDKDEWIKSRYWEIKRYVGYHYARLLMNWNDPSTSQKSELVFAINEMRTCSSKGALTKNAPLMFIAQIGRLYSHDNKYASGKNDLSEQERRSVVNLILEACVEAYRSNLVQKHSFTAQVARSLRQLNANKECIKIVRALVARVGRCHHQVALEEAIYAATEERDYESLEVFMNKFEESGYDSTQLLI